MLIDRFGGVIAAIIWLIGAPLVAIAGVPFPSDAQYLVMGAIAALMGLALAPLTLSIGGASFPRTQGVIRFSGVAVCIALITSGVVLVIAAEGGLGERVTGVIPGTSFVVFVALFVWISVASYALRGPSKIERSIFWLGLLTGASFVVPVLASILIFYVAQAFLPQGLVVTDATVLPILLIELLVWVSLPAWLIAVVVGLSARGAT